MPMLLLLVVVVGLLAVWSATATVIHSPLQFSDVCLEAFLRREKLALGRHFNDVQEHRKLKREGQIPLAGSIPHHVEIWDAPFPNQLLIPAALGNPAQPFRLQLDLAWDTLFVPSAILLAPLTGQDDDLLRYYSNRSSTFSPGHEWLATVYGTNRFEGNLSIDTFRIAGLELPYQPFLNADDSSPLGFVDFWFGYDGVLGLAPRWNTSIDETLTPSPWAVMVNQSLLDRNLFAIDVPRGPRNMFEIARTGEVSFGSISPKYRSSHFSTLPLSDYNDQVWAVEAQSLTFENETHPIHQNFVNMTLAGFDTTSWFIGLPGNWSKLIYAQVPHDCGFIWCFVDCVQRKKMPNLTFKLAGQNFSLTPYDYAPEFVTNGQSVCSFEIWSTDSYYPVDTIVLGPQFLNAFYGVFDLDNREIRLSKGIE